jgi:hypothetical protein
MAKYLQIGEGQKWSLAEDADFEQLRTRLTGAMNDGLATNVEVRLSEKTTGDLLINGKAVTSILLWEDVATGTGHRPTFTMID